MIDVNIAEVAPRDGFQAVRAFIPTETRIAPIEELAACGFSRIEIGSFVSPRRCRSWPTRPDILKRARVPAGTRVMALVPNARRLDLALQAGIGEIGWVISVTESHNRSNVRRRVEESFRDFAAAKNACAEVRNLRFPAEIIACADTFVMLQKARHSADYDPAHRLRREQAMTLVSAADHAIRTLRSAPRRDRRAFAIQLLLKKRPG